MSILVQTEAPPVTLSWEINLENGITYSFPDSGGGLGKGTSIAGTGRFVLNRGSGIIRLTARASSTREQTVLPTEYSLVQNYPNPFNPTTTISYGLPSDSYVSIKVFDLLGREVSSLVERHEKAGWHGVSFDGSQLSSGVYFYRMLARSFSGGNAGNFTEVKKLLLMK